MSRLIILNRDEQEEVEYLAKQLGVSPDDYVRAAINFYSACRTFGYEYDTVTRPETIPMRLTPMAPSDKAYDGSPCQYCSNNPRNGGSGICHCILGQQTIC